jgi:hypothetical protein
MNTQRIPVRIAKGLTLIRNEAARLDSARIEGHEDEANAALSTIRNECDHLRQYVGMLVDRAGSRAG